MLSLTHVPDHFNLTSPEPTATVYILTALCLNEALDTMILLYNIIITRLEKIVGVKYSFIA